MNEIKLSVDDKNLETVLTILNNLKTGLITDIETNGKISKVRPTQYQPKMKTIMKDDDFGTKDSSGKYINPAAYKQRLKNKK
ncbi:hypothetical protein SAMN06313540_10313 [Epsilonproteobacteria bacterium SCGC AD-308-E02]|jgi:hypothetical protein|nr:hypothetical protein SAMN06313540_10313 [Epsilonproteobacteria bacterium SCGC AD-308-E02]